MRSQSRQKLSEPYRGEPGQSLGGESANERLGRGLEEAWKRLSGLATEAVREGYPGQGAGTGGQPTGRCPWWARRAFRYLEN